MGSLLAKHWSSWSLLEELRRLVCLILVRVLWRQFLFCSVWVRHFLRHGTRVLQAILVSRGVLWTGIRKIEFSTREIVHPQQIIACLSRQRMCDRYHGRPTVVLKTYSLDSLSKWAGRFVFSSWHGFAIVRTWPRDTSFLGVRDVRMLRRDPLSFSALSFSFDFQ